jgi:pimeloyl-ACP methyl ester carboxylesterase
MRLAQRLVLNYIRTKFKLLSSISKRKAAEKAFVLFCTPQQRNKKSRSPVFNKAEKLEFNLEGNKVRGYRWNHPANKKALILHGFESSIVNFGHFIEPLIQKGYEVLAFDAPAHGLSTGNTITVITYKNMIRHIYKEYGPIDAFISHSFGGLTLALALEELEQLPEQKIVFIAPAAETKTAIDNFFRLLQLDQQVRKEFDLLIEREGGKPPEWFSVSRMAPHIKGQVLFLQDKNDELTPLKDVEPIMRMNLPNFGFLISEGFGHSRIYRENQSLKAIMDFL